MITEQDIQFYQDNGYLVIEGLFDKSEVKQALDAIEELTTGEDSQSNYEIEPADKQTIRRIWSPTKKHSTFWDMTKCDKLLDPIQALIGENILFHYSKLNMKGPKVGSVIEWHQDFSYYPHTNSDLLTALIMLDDVTADNGPLRVVPGSHKLGLVNHYVDGYFRGRVSDVQENNAKELIVPAGSVIFLHCMTLHASEKNMSDQPRRAFLPAYRAADSFPIYFGPHASHNEAGTVLLRGNRSTVARVEQGTHYLPLAEKEFGSIYEVQEGSHLKKEVDTMKTTGYAVD